ncbi:MAG: hypothetical protein ACJZ1O_00430 [Candidatus Neomarinimicrobiota bacterium]
MSELISDRIYNAQCLGNIEPVEYIVPYPNIFSLLEGENIKFGNNYLFLDQKITNNDFLILINKASNWLRENQLDTKSRVLVENIDFPIAEIIIFAIWASGSSVILCQDSINKNELAKVNPDMIINDANCPSLDSLNKYPSEFIPYFRPSLHHEALLFYKRNTFIQLSHYNLLVNTSGTCKHLDLKRGTRIKINIPSKSTAWIILQLLLPLYAGMAITNKDPDITIGLEDQYHTADYIIKMNWDKISNKKRIIYILEENTAVICIGDKPIHMTSIEVSKGNIYVKGHSIMMGYIDKKSNDSIFNKKSMIIKNNLV